MPKSTFTSIGFFKLFSFNPIDLFVLCDHHLRNTLTVINNKRLVAKVHQQHLYFTTVVGINCSGCI